jgi:hypothetical protein
MLKCKEIAGMLASDGLETAPWTRRLAVRLHLAMCRHCLEASILSSAGDRAGSKGDGESRSKKSSDPLDNEDFS